MRWRAGTSQPSVGPPNSRGRAQVIWAPASLQAQPPPPRPPWPSSTQPSSRVRLSRLTCSEAACCRSARPHMVSVGALCCKLEAAGCAWQTDLQGAILTPRTRRRPASPVSARVCRWWPARGVRRRWRGRAAPLIRAFLVVPPPPPPPRRGPAAPAFSALLRLACLVPRPERFPLHTWSPAISLSAAPRTNQGTVVAAAAAACPSELCLIPGHIQSYPVPF